MNGTGSRKRYHIGLKIIMILTVLFLFSFINSVNIAGNSNEYIAPGPVDYWEHYNRTRDILREKNSLDRWLEENTIEPLIPSTAVAVVLGDRVVYRKAIRSSFKRLYSVASFTKTFTAIAVLQLAERGMLSLDDPVSLFLPMKLENPDLDSGPITIRHLLTHTSGLIDSGESEQVDKNTSLIVPYQRYPAGYRFYYSNLGYRLLGHLVVRISGEPLDRYITGNILGPLGMNESVAQPSMHGAGGLLCTLDDLVKYITMLAGKGKYAGGHIISEKTFEEIFMESTELPAAKYKEFRGTGWRVWTIDGTGYSMNHAALWDNSGGWIQVFPTLRVAYVFMSNPPDYDREDFYEYHRGLKHRLLNMAGLLSNVDLNPVDFHVSLPVKSDLVNFTGRYRHMLNGTHIDVTISPSGFLMAQKTETGEIYDLYPSAKSTFIYIFPDQTEKGYAFDFVYHHGRLIGLAAMDGYYVREEHIHYSR